jgi:dihydrofolate reductase
MGQVILEISISLDGFVAGPNIRPEVPLGENGTLLHDWMFKYKTERDTAMSDAFIKSIGAVLVGGRTYHDAIDNDKGWGGANPFTMPAIVVTTRVPQNAPAGFTFVTDGIESALTQARATAGEKDIWIMGGANLAQQYLKASLVDEIHLHVVPYLLGSGTRLFDHIGSDVIQLEKLDVVDSAVVTHMRFRVVK